MAGAVDAERTVRIAVTADASIAEHAAHRGENETAERHSAQTVQCERRAPDGGGDALGIADVDRALFYCLTSIISLLHRRHSSLSPSGDREDAPPLSMKILHRTRATSAPLDGETSAR